MGSQTWLGFMPGREIIYATFIVCHIEEKCLAKKKKLNFVIIDLEKAFDRVYRGVVRWAMRKPNVDEWVIETIMAMYEFSNSALRINNTLGNKFNVKRGVLQRSVLKPFGVYHGLWSIIQKVYKCSVIENALCRWPCDKGVLYFFFLAGHLFE